MAVAALGGLFVAGTVGTAEPASQLFGPAIVRGPTDRPWVALTFDDGPDPDSTPVLLDALDAAGATATFFVLADRVTRWPELARRMAERHEVALHGLHHDASLAWTAPARGAAMLREARATVEQATGIELRWFRPPFGVMSPRVSQSVAGADLTLVWCSVRTRDGVGGTPDWLRRRCLRAGPGDIVLLHEGPRPARVALPGILEDLTARGLRTVTVGEMLR